jgi:LysM domain
MAKPGDAFDPKQHYAGVKMQRGRVQQDSDWNREASGRDSGVRRRGGRRWLIPAGGVVVVLAAVGIFLLARRIGPPLAFRAMSGPVANIATPVEGTIVALHSTVGVTGEGTSPAGIRELQLWVNGKPWASQLFGLPLQRASATWGWTPSGEGEHILVVKAVSAGGELAESDTVRVLAAMAADVRFPVAVEVHTGDSLSSLAQNYETSVEGILEGNPGLDLNAPLNPGQTLTVPVPMPNQPETAPEGGGDPAPPVGDVKPAPGASVQEIASDYVQAVGPQAHLGWRDFKISNGTITPNQPVEKIFLYVSADGADWERIPADEHDYLFSATGDFDVKPLLQPLLAEADGDVQVSLEVWAWRDGALVFLGSFYGKLSAADSGPQLAPSSSTELEAVDYVYLAKKFYTKSFALTSAQLSTDREFHWTTSVPGVTYGLWQVSTQAFPPGTSLNPPGLVHQGVSSAGNGTFTLRFNDYFTSSQGGGGGFGGLGDLFGQAQEWFDSLEGKEPPTQTFNIWQPRFFVVRVIPMTGSPLMGSTAAQIAGPASLPVFVWYQFLGNPYQPGLEPKGPVYQATILNFTPFQPADPDYKACFLSTYEMRNCNNVVPGAYTVMSQGVGNIVVNGKTITPQQFQQCQLIIPKGAPSCGCPGVSCSGSSSSCSGWDPTTYGDCLADAGEWAAGALQDTYNFVSGWYNKAVSFVKEWAAKLNPLCIQAKVAAAQFGGDSVTEEDVDDVCAAATEIAVTAVQIYFGIPPSLPNFDQIMDEGLDYAISMTATQLGIDCNPQCVALLKKGFQGAASGENLYQAGLDVGASMAASELNKIGVSCDAKCRQLIQAGVQGKATFGQVSDAVLDQTAQQIAAKLNATGYPCDAKCQAAIRLGLGTGAAVGETAAAGAAQPKPILFYEPHPLASSQPANMRVSVFRRYESANVPQPDLDNCVLQVFTQETNTLDSGTPINGAPFIAQSLSLPLLKPGQSITIPIVLDHPPGSYFYSSPGASFNWAALYYGGQLHVRVTGPAFITSAGGGQALPCIAEDTWTGTAPE